MPASPLRLRVVIASSLDRPLPLTDAVRSIQACVRPAGVDIAITIVGSGVDATGADRVPVLADAGVSFLALGAPGKSRALNFALTRFPDDFWLMSDDDVLVPPTWLVRYVEAIRASRGPHHFGGGLDVIQLAPPPRWLVPHLPASAAGWPGPTTEQAGAQMPSFLGANWGAWAHDLIAVGGFDPRVGPGGSAHATGTETTMQVALRAAGSVPVFVDDARVEHLVPKVRSTPAWALRRAFKDGVGFGLSRAHDVRFIGGVPVRATIRAAADTAAAMGKVAVLRSVPRSFNRIVQAARSAGALIGERRGRR